MSDSVFIKSVLPKITNPHTNGRFDMKKILALSLALLMLLGTLVSCSKDKTLYYRYDYDLSDYIELGEYKHLPAKGYTIEITDEDVQRQIQGALVNYSRLNDVTDRGAKIGDVVYLDYVATIDGEEFEGGSETDCEITLGTASLLLELEVGLVGVMAGETRSFDLTFPDPYPQAPEHAGEDVHFEVTVNNVCEMELPEYTDEFVKAYYGFDTREELEEEARRLLEDRYQEIYYQYIAAQVVDQVLDATVVKKIPQKEYDRLYEARVQLDQAYAETYGLSFAAFLNFSYQQTEEEYYAAIKEDIEARIKREMVLYAIARAENITLTDEEYVTRATKDATDYYGYASLEAFEAFYGKDDIREIVLEEMAVEKIVDYADVTIEE